MKRLALFVVTALAMLAFPVTLFAAEAPAEGGGGIALGPILAIGAAIVGALGALVNLFPAGWKTYINTGLGVTIAGLAGLTELSQTHPQATIMAIVIAFVGAIIGRAKAKPVS